MVCIWWEMLSGFLLIYIFCIVNWIGMGSFTCSLDAFNKVPKTCLTLTASWKKCLSPPLWNLHCHGQTPRQRTVVAGKLGKLVRCWWLGAGVTSERVIKETQEERPELCLLVREETIALKFALEVYTWSLIKRRRDYTERWQEGGDQDSGWHSRI